jgi:putative exporter of polyketide antibiotics
VPKIIDEKVLGSAYCLIFWVQNIGLCLVPLLIGSVLDKVNANNPAVIAAKEQIEQLHAAGVENPDVFIPYDYTIPMVIFAGFGVLALFIGIYLKMLDAKKHYGLELPNIAPENKEA